MMIGFFIQAACISQVSSLNKYSSQEALDSFVCLNESKINIPLPPLAAYPDQTIISFFLNISRTLHRRAENVDNRTSLANHNYWTAQQVDQLMWVLLMFCFSGKLAMEKGPFGAYPILNINPVDSKNNSSKKFLEICFGSILGYFIQIWGKLWLPC